MKRRPHTRFPTATDEQRPVGPMETDPAPDPCGGDPAALAREATLASERAMRGRRWAEARALAALAENYARLGARSAHGKGRTVETMDLQQLFDVLVDDRGAVVERFRLDPDRTDDPDRPLKEEYHRRDYETVMCIRHRHMAMLRRIHAAEAQLREAGIAVIVSHSGYDSVAETREWLLTVATGMDDVTVMPSPPPGNPWNIGQ